MTRPGNGPYKPSLADGMYHYQFSIRISPRIEQMLEARLVRDKKNRSDWVREAIVEKLAREGQVTTGKETEEAPKLREKLGEKCPHCGRLLWSNTEKRAKPVNALPFRMFT